MSETIILAIVVSLVIIIFSDAIHNIILTPISYMIIFIKSFIMSYLLHNNAGIGWWIIFYLLAFQGCGLITMEHVKAVKKMDEEQ
jgi:Ca2+/Na+ antiporter